MYFTDAIETCLRRYATFEGRAIRSEYWFFVLFTILASIGSALLDAAFFVDIVDIVVSPLNTLVSLALLLPSLAVGVRRLHDSNRSGWWLLIGIVPLVGWLILLIWLCRRGDAGPNRFGPNPLAGSFFADAHAA